MQTPPFVPLSTNRASLRDKYTDLTKCKAKEGQSEKSIVNYAVSVLLSLSKNPRGLLTVSMLYPETLIRPCLIENLF